jgi:methionine--tRNA ligase beta chain
MKKDTIPFSDLMKIDIRVGKVTQAVIVEESKKLIKLTVDLGEEYGVVTIFTAMRAWYTPEDFIDKTFPFIANLEPKKMLDRESQGMILAADQDEKPVLIPLDPTLRPGTKLI